MHAPHTDAIAREIALSRFALPPSLHIPVAARDETALEQFVGTIEQALATGQTKAFLLRAYDPPCPDPRLPIWNEPGAAVLHSPLQVWVDVNHAAYRRSYASAFPEEDLRDLVLDHVMNRRVARLKGFQYLRIVPISRAANSSSGGLSEKWAVAYHGTPTMIHMNMAAATFIQYADLADIVKMLNIKTGGSLQDAVNDAQALVTPR